MAGFKTGTIGALAQMNIATGDIGALAVTDAKIAPGITATKLSSGAVTGLLTGRNIGLGAVTPRALSSGAATGLLTFKYIEAGTVKNANLSGPENIMHVRFRDRQLATSTAVPANSNYTIMDRFELPVAATLMKATAWASQGVGHSHVRVRIANISGTNLLVGSGIVISALATIRSGAISAGVAAQSAGSVIAATIWSSTTFSLLGPLYVDTFWKVPHTT